MDKKKGKIRGIHVKVTVGNGLLTQKAYRRMLVQEANAVITDTADSLLIHADLLTNKDEKVLEIILVSGKDLGFLKRYNIQDLIKIAGEWGFLPCSDDIGPQLCKQLELETTVIIAMWPIKTTANELKIFEVVLNSGVRWLRTLPGNRDFKFPIEAIWALVVPEQEDIS